MTGSPCPICQSPLAPGQDPCPSCGAALGLGASAPARNLAVGSTLHQGKFTVGRVLGEGGFGITYKGAHRDLRRPVAVKELFPLDLGATRLGPRVSVPAPQADAFRYARDQALQEARIIAGFRSRNIVDVYDMFLENDTAYIVMEYLEGETLEARLERVGNLPPDEVQELAKALCEALAEVHDGNWLHRDIKPSNIVLAADQRVVLIDFGSAREFHLHRTQRHTRILTAQYAAPEQYSEEARFGPYTDAFSLGATLYHALTGAPPPSAMDRFQSGRALDFPPGVPSRLAAALQQALTLRVDDRPSSMAALLALIQKPTSTAMGTAFDRVGDEFISLTDEVEESSPSDSVNIVFAGSGLSDEFEVVSEVEEKYDVHDVPRFVIEDQVVVKSTGPSVPSVPDASEVLIDDPITVGALAEAVGRSPIDLLRILMKFGMMVPITQAIDFETASIVCAELDIQIGLKPEQPEKPTKAKET